MTFARKVLCGLDAFKEWALSTFSPKDHNHDSRYALKSSVSSESASVSYYFPDYDAFEKDNEKYENDNGQMVANANNITVDDGCAIQLLKNANDIPYSFRINGEMIDLKEYWEEDDPRIMTARIGNLVIIAGTTHKLKPKGTATSRGTNQLLRIWTGYSSGFTFISANLTSINYFENKVGVEADPHFVAFIDGWLYVYVDGNGNARPFTGVSFTVFGKRR